MRTSGQNVVFIADSEPVGSPDESQNNEPYEGAPPEIHEVRSTLRTAVVGPYPDKWGEWISALVPLRAPGAHVPFILGIDLSAANYSAAVWRERAKGAAIGLMLSGVALVMLAVYRAFQEAVRSRDPARLTSP
jgi:hypothetical protein